MLGRKLIWLSLRWCKDIVIYRVDTELDISLFVSLFPKNTKKKKNIVVYLANDIGEKYCFIERK